MSKHYHILMVHNHYKKVGGEDISTRVETDMLRQLGHQVTLIEKNNDIIQSFTLRQEIQLFFETAWNTHTYQEFQDYLKDLKPDLMHIQNFFPLFSPSIHASAKQQGIPTVQHLRNFRLVCLNAYLFRDGKICEDCLGHNPWRGVWYRCYRQSFPASLGVWNMVTFNRWRKTWLREVDAFITPSQFAATKLLQAGIPENRLFVKPNTVADPLENDEIPPLPEVPTFIFAGRFSPEKGILTLLQAWRNLDRSDWQLCLIGDGLEQTILQRFVVDHQLYSVKFLGQLSTTEVLQSFQSASVIVVPSQWYETFGRVVIEAYACGRSVLASDLGALTELVQEGGTGFRVTPNDINAWAERLQWCGEHTTELVRMGQYARKIYKQHYTHAVNCQQLLDIYEQVLY